MIRKIAVPVDYNNILDAHFGHCKFFLLMQVEEGNIITEEKLRPPPHEPGVLPKWLAEKGVTDILAGGMGQKAIQVFNQYRVNVFVGVPQLCAKDLVDGFLNETISFSANYCDH